MRMEREPLTRIVAGWHSKGSNALISFSCSLKWYAPSPKARAVLELNSP